MGRCNRPPALRGKLGRRPVPVTYGERQQTLERDVTVVDHFLDKTVENLLSITDEYVEWNHQDRKAIGGRFRTVIGMFGEAKKSRRRAPSDGETK